MLGESDGVGLRTGWCRQPSLSTGCGKEAQQDGGWRDCAFSGPTAPTFPVLMSGPFSAWLWTGGINLGLKLLVRWLWTKSPELCDVFPTLYQNMLLQVQGCDNQRGLGTNTQGPLTGVRRLFSLPRPQVQERPGQLLAQLR